MILSFVFCLRQVKQSFLFLEMNGYLLYKRRSSIIIEKEICNWSSVVWKWERKGTKEGMVFIIVGRG